MSAPFKKLLVANRGEIAIRILRTAREMELDTVAIYSEADRNSAHLKEADQSICVGPAESNQSYLNIEAILQAAKQTGAEAIHPGYGFLSEKAHFAQAVEKAGLVFVGPKAAHIEQMGDKVKARDLVSSLGLPILRGTGPLEDLDTAFSTVEALLKKDSDFRFPLLVKAAGGGGGKGMRLVRKADELKAALERAQSESKKAFNNPTIFVERYIEQPRHIEVQVFGDGHSALHLYERECSLQRRHQKVVEEALSPSITEETRATMLEKARLATEKLNYMGAGTIEFIVAPDDAFYFLEMNTRIQVEHPTTEWVTQTDLVREQIRVAQGERLSWSQDQIQPRGHSIELRLYAEDPEQEFLPQPGFVEQLSFPHWNGLRVDTALMEAGEISSFYDPMIAKLSVWGVNREQARRRALLSLLNTRIEGCVTNRPFLLEILESDFFKQGSYHTGLLESGDWRKKTEASEDLIAALCLKDYLSRAGGLRPQALSEWQQREVI